MQTWLSFVNLIFTVRVIGGLEVYLQEEGKLLWQEDESFGPAD